METVIPGLHASSPDRLPFATSLEIRAFLLQREQGNLLVYSAPTLTADVPAIEALGGVSRQYLNHWHEAIFATDAVRAPVFCHEDDRAHAAERIAIDETFSGRSTLDGDFELIPIPGHTPGATAFLWDSGEHRALFTGDSIYLHEGEWIAALDVTGSDRTAYVASLELLRELEFDVLVPWAATAGEPFHTMTGRRDARRRLDAILERVRRGENR
jgi:glyoxylase-like metal-dependent hydrolase (beta-lactamase superfamily II)